MKKKTVRTFLLALAFLVFFVFLLSSCEMHSLIDKWSETSAATVFLPSTEAPPTTTTAATAATTATPAATTTSALTESPVSPIYRNPLTGLNEALAAVKARPLAFCVGRATSDRVAKADVVIEAPTEAAATRLSLLGVSHTALFPDLEIASTRAHLAALTHDFFGISVYSGTSDNGLASIEFLYDTLDLSVKNCERTEEALRDALDAAGIQAEHAGGIVLPYPHVPQGETVIPDGNAASYVSVPFSEGSATTFTYDAVRGQYTMRTSSAMIEGDASPAFSNLILLFYDATRHITKDGVALTLDTELGGSGFYLSGGRVIPIFWRRDAITSSLTLTDTDGNRLAVNLGKTYVGMMTYEYRDRLIMN